MYTLRKKKILVLDIIKGQWRVFDGAVAFGFNKTHFYTALKWTQLVESATWGISRSIMQVNELNIVWRMPEVTTAADLFQIQAKCQQASPLKPWN